ncbi:major histocompatibility complex class I-related gene protein-like [Fundulus heteroclitus]|uniref:major histocompatibility complex class I-related gene protein-like n=1 Tax=Fundulus heteroclitus TaxID=8078 RepID=UPI00165A1F83|nr:major histocompatibility complex class I-related gene protein-like [Fundulus heteroclitus]
MLIFIFLLLMEIHSTAAVTHTLKHFYTTSSQVTNFPQFVAVGLVDDVQIDYYDSNTQRCEPKQNWMKDVVDPQYWEMKTGSCLCAQWTFKADMEIAKQCFNQTEGVHIFQRMYGCEWNDETEEVTGYEQYGYDGEDWIKWNVKVNRWIAAKQQAEITTNQWNNDRVELARKNNYLNQECPAWLKKFVDSGRSSLMRTDLPSVSFLQKSFSSPVSCHATGFYPNRAEMFWRKDGEEVHDGVVKGEILPNNDGTFQMSVDINLSSVAPEDWSKYECVFQLSGVKEEIHRLEKTRIRSNESNIMMIIPVAAVVAPIVVLCVLGGIVFIYYQKKNQTKTRSQETASLSVMTDDSQGSNPSDKPLLRRKANPNS